MTPLYTIEQIRAIESAHAASHPKTSLMQRAGEAVATRARALMKQHKLTRALVLAGPGNNGGDAWVAAATLLKAKVDIGVLALGEQQFTDPAAKKAHDAYVKAQGVVGKAWPDDVSDMLVIDGLFGIGLARAPSGLFADTIAASNAARASGNTVVLAIDIPSGLNANAGAAFQPSIEADETITFIGAKPGLYTNDGPDHAGTVTTDTLDVESTDEITTTLLTKDDLLPLIPARRKNSHKGSYGNVGIIGGAEGMVGAAVLAARAALHMGPGKVYLGIFDKDRPAYDVLHPEIMVRDARVLAKDETMTSFAVGMGTGEGGAASLLHLIGLTKPMVIDADALNAIASNTSIRAAFQAKREDPTRKLNISATGRYEPFDPQKNAGPRAESFEGQNALPLPEPPLKSLPFILTPHPGEAARLLNITTAEVQADRVHAAQKIATSFGCVTVLKGAGSVIATPEGNVAINSTGNPGMASGGTGDALAGMLAAFLAMGLTTWDAARLGVYLHGAAGDSAIHHGMGPHGLTASEIVFEARTLLNAGLEDGHDD
jgi:ADP-dependent NAD(P)H-hydrate dehydratase / NAD(P)H-hydrate epimerase